MNYIYDIYINLNDTLYDFFDWNKSDKITHIKKLPVLKINEEQFKKITYNKINIKEELLLKIYNKTEIWGVNDKINYCILFTDGYNIIVIEFNNKGNSIKKSYLYIDEELEILEIVNKISEEKIEFKIISKDKNLFKTRKQIKEEKFIYRELKNINENKWNYIYFECFGKQEKNKKVILKDINKFNKNSIILNKLYDILKLTSTYKK